MNWQGRQGFQAITKVMTIKSMVPGNQCIQKRNEPVAEKLVKTLCRLVRVGQSITTGFLYQKDRGMSNSNLELLEEYPGSSVVKTPCFQHRGYKFDPCLGSLRS